MKKLVLMSLILLISIFMSCAFAYDIINPDTNPPTGCTIRISDSDYYVNSKFISIDLVAEDESDIYVWLSNDGLTGSSFKYQKNKTVTLNTNTFEIGNDCTTLSTTNNNSNVFRVVNWPISEVNGPQKVYVVFKDSYGNSTSTGGLTKSVTVTFQKNTTNGTTKGWTFELPEPITLLKGGSVEMPSGYQKGKIDYYLKGWSTQNIANAGLATTMAPNYLVGEVVTGINSDMTLYTVCERSTVLKYVEYKYDTTKSLSGLADIEPNSFNNMNLDNESPFVLTNVNDGNIWLIPTKTSQLYNFFDTTPASKFSANYYTAGAANSILDLYKNSYANQVQIANNNTGIPYAYDANVPITAGYVKCPDNLFWSSNSTTGTGANIRYNAIQYLAYNATNHTHTKTTYTTVAGQTYTVYLLPGIQVSNPALVHLVYSIQGATGTYDAPLRFVPN